MARLLTLTLLCLALMGCELIADFDSSKIPDDRPAMDSGANDEVIVPVSDSAVDEDAGANEDAGPGDEDAG